MVAEENTHTNRTVVGMQPSPGTTQSRALVVVTYLRVPDAAEPPYKGTIALLILACFFPNRKLDTQKYITW